VDSLFRSKSGRKITTVPPSRFLYGNIVKDGEILDEVIVRRKETDRIYGAETVEIGCHAGGAAAHAIIDALVELGAAHVSFDKVLEAACAQGRISRIEMDAHVALRSCVSGKALPVLLAELDRHHLEREIESICRLIGEGSSQAAQLIRHLLKNSWAIPYVEPQSVFITGFPNVGKSSLFNALTGRERVIVHDTAGTTRDVVDELVLLDEVPVRLLDSAGVGESKTEIEKLAEEFAFRAMEEAALILFVFDSSRPAKEAELKLYRQLDSELLIPIINKTDLPPAGIVPEVSGALKVSALTGKGVPALREEIAGKLARQPRETGEPVVFAAKQRDLLREALERLEAGNGRKALELWQAAGLSRRDFFKSGYATPRK
jgi:tRNA modification GTPase